MEAIMWLILQGRKRERKIQKIVTYPVDLYLGIAWTSSNEMSAYKF